jgi:hypothetical protein
MSAPDEAPVAGVSLQLSLIDVLSVPTIGAAVVQHLQWLRRGVSAVRQTCSALCALVRHRHGNVDVDNSTDWCFNTNESSCALDCRWINISTTFAYSLKVQKMGPLVGNLPEGHSDPSG